jgi:hypothetical protein
MQFHSTVSQTSKHFPDVTFTFRVITEGVRAKLDVKLADPLSEIRSLQLELTQINMPVDDKGDIISDAKLPMADMIKVNELAEKMASIRRNKIDPVYFETCFVQVEGLSIDPMDAPVGETPIKNPATLRDFGPPKLYHEIIAAILTEARLSVQEKENLESPITSAAEADGQTSDTTAASADEKSTTSIETVASSSHAT